MVKYRMNLNDEKKETAIKIALDSKGNVRKRKIAVPLLMILGIVIIISSLFLIINSPAALWYIYMVIGIISLFLAFNAKSFQKFALKKAELLHLEILNPAWIFCILLWEVFRWDCCWRNAFAY